MKDDGASTEVMAVEMVIPDFSISRTNEKENKKVEDWNRVANILFCQEYIFEKYNPPLSTIVIS